MLCKSVPYIVEFNPEKGFPEGAAEFLVITHPEWFDTNDPYIKF
jgi:hypothetical protein